MNVCKECEFFEQQPRMPYSSECFSPAIRKEHASLVYGTPSSVYCKTARKSEYPPPCVIHDCPHWAERAARVKPRGILKRIFG